MKRMREVFLEAYFLLFKDEPIEEMEEWQVIEAVLDNFDIRTLGEEKAQEFLIEVISNHRISGAEKIRQIVGKAEELSTEVFPKIISDEPHMAKFEAIGWERQEEEVFSALCR